jgi:hypothetical protein
LPIIADLMGLAVAAAFGLTAVAIDRGLAAVATRRVAARAGFCEDTDAEDASEEAAVVSAAATPPPASAAQPTPTLKAPAPNHA